MGQLPLNLIWGYPLGQGTKLFFFFPSSLFFRPIFTLSLYLSFSARLAVLRISYTPSLPLALSCSLLLEPPSTSVSVRSLSRIWTCWFFFLPLQFTCLVYVTVSSLFTMTSLLCWEKTFSSCCFTERLSKIDVAV